MTLRDACRKEILRMSGMPFYPTEPLAVKELVDTLEDSSVNPEHAHKTVDELSRGDRCPLKADIIRVAFALRPPAAQPHDGCPLCGGTGWKQVLRDGYSGVVKCEGRA